MKDSQGKRIVKDDFESVARRLECDPDLKKFDAQLRKIAKARVKPKAKGTK